MRWRPTDPVQEVGAVIVTGPAAVARLADAMTRKASLIQSLPVVHGPAWAVVFAAPLSAPARDGEDRVLPRLEGATPLYEAEPGCWLPVGVALDAPDHALPALWRMILDHYAVTPRSSSSPAQARSPVERVSETSIQSASRSPSRSRR
jgi:hypothetical protein